MSQRRRVSRRAFIKAAAASPFFAAATRAWSEPTERNLEDVIRLADLPKDWEKDLRAKYKKKFPGIDPDLLDQIVVIWAVLWTEFHHGLGEAAKDPTESWVHVAYEAPSKKKNKPTGEVIKDSVSQDKFKNPETLVKTMECAFRTGKAAARLADSGPVKKEHYVKARDHVEDEQTALLSRAVRLASASGDPRTLAAAC